MMECGSETSEESKSEEGEWTESRKRRVEDRIRWIKEMLENVREEI